MKKQFTHFFYHFSERDLYKDLGIITAIYANEMNYHATILCEKFEGDQSVAKERGIEVVETKDPIVITTYLKKTDLLFLIGYYEFDFKVIKEYRQIRPDGKIYLKTDMNPLWLNVINAEGPKTDILKLCDLVSVESTKLHENMNQNWGVPVVQVVNGYHDLQIDRMISFEEKENIIITVARLGTYDKATDTLLQAFALAAPSLPDWKLKLVGPMEPHFHTYYDNFLETHASIRDQIIYAGPIYDRKALEEEYVKAKVFTLPSRSEGFPNVYAEAAIKGCFIVCTDIGPALDMTNFGKFGTSVPIDDVVELAFALKDACMDEKRLEEVCYGTQLRTRREFDWVKNIYRIEQMLYGYIGLSD